MGASTEIGKMPGLAVPTDRLRPFDPVGLGRNRPRFASLLEEIGGLRQSEIIRVLSKAAKELEQKRGLEDLGLRVSLLVLRDYVAAGHYPLVAEGRCFLAPLSEARTSDKASNSQSLRRLNETNRNRALVERNQIGWLQRVAEALEGNQYSSRELIAKLGEAPPFLSLVQAQTSERPLDPRGLWRAVRATWSMNVEASAPGREVAFVALDERFPETPLGILQLRNIVPEIQARDAWLGIVFSDSQGKFGYLQLLEKFDVDDRLDAIAATGRLFSHLLSGVETDGLNQIDLEEKSIPLFAELASRHRVRFNEAKRDGISTAAGFLHVVKRAETAADLLRGLKAVDGVLKARDVYLLKRDRSLRADFDAGLRKLWHYHMGFVALELSICGAAPPFGPLRVGKLMAALAGSENAIHAWGIERPLGAIARHVFRPDIRERVPNPGPLFVFTSGLYPGHSAQYNRVRVGSEPWRHIGDTTGFGSSHVSFETLQAVRAFNIGVDRYDHISRKFGEGSGPRFRSIGRALARLALPDLLRHETSRPLYALSLQPKAREILLGWETAARPTGVPIADLAHDWWHRWIRPRKSELMVEADRSPDLVDAIKEILVSVAAIE